MKCGRLFGMPILDRKFCQGLTARVSPPGRLRPSQGPEMAGFFTVDQVILHILSIMKIRPRSGKQQGDCRIRNPHCRQLAD